MKSKRRHRYSIVCNAKKYCVHINWYELSSVLDLTLVRGRNVWQWADLLNKSEFFSVRLIRWSCYIFSNGVQYCTLRLILKKHFTYLITIREERACACAGARTPERVESRQDKRRISREDEGCDIIHRPWQHLFVFGTHSVAPLCCRVPTTRHDTDTTTASRLHIEGVSARTEKV